MNLNIPTILNIESSAYLIDAIFAFIFGVLFYNYYYNRNVRPRIENWVYSEEIEAGKEQKRSVKIIPKIMVIILAALCCALVIAVITRGGRSFAGIAIGFITATIIYISQLDFKYGEMYVFEETTLPVMLFITGIIYNSMYGCDCLKVRLIIFFVAWLCLIVLDNILNRQFNIGIVDIDNIAAVIMVALAVASAIKEKSTVLAMGYLANICALFFINIVLYIVFIFIYKKVIKGDKIGNKVRMMPGFIIPYIYVVLTVFSVFK